MGKRKDNTSRFNMTLENIMEAVTEVTGIAVDGLKGYERQPEIKEAKLLFYAAGRANGFTYKQIGLSVNRSHSSIMNTLSDYKATPDFKLKLKQVLKRMGTKDEKGSPLWDEDFKIVDISSRYFGECFAGVINDEMICSGGYYKVVNRMLDIKNTHEKEKSSINAVGHSQRSKDRGVE